MATNRIVGFVGIGNMGEPMVSCLLKAAIPVLAYDRDSNRLGALKLSADNAGSGLEIASSPSDVGRRSDIVITMLPDSKVVNTVVLGADCVPGVASSLRPGSIIIDMSSSYPLDTRALGAELGEHRIGLIDAPVSGGVAKAMAGTLAIMAGGEPALLDRVEPVLRAMGTVHRTGKLGSGHAMKALNNYVSAAGLVATCEALVVGAKFGLDSAVMTRVLNASTGRNNTTENKVERFMLNRRFDSGFALALMEKDVGMARRLAEEIGVGADELAFVSAYLGLALGKLGRDADHTAILRFAEASVRKS